VTPTAKERLLAEAGNTAGAAGPLRQQNENALAADGENDYQPLLSSLSYPQNPHPEPNGFPLGWRARGLLSAWSLMLLGGFFVAYRLEPDPRGFGTHQRLGLPPCTIRTVFGIPCPSCGMTTSIANVTKGRWREAAQASLAAILLSLVCAALIPWCWLSAFYGRLCWVTRPDLLAALVAGSIGGVAAVEWVIRLWFLSSPSRLSQF